MNSTNFGFSLFGLSLTTKYLFENLNGHVISLVSMRHLNSVTDWRFPWPKTELLNVLIPPVYVRNRKEKDTAVNIVKMQVRTK